MATVHGTNASETISGSDGVTNGPDLIWGYGGDDDIYGLGGDDVIVGGQGADDIYGGPGSDFSSYFTSGTGVTVSLGTGLGYSGDAAGDNLNSIENLSGSLFDDLLVGNGGANVLVGLAGRDVLKGGGGADTLYGDLGNDTLYGGDAGDTLHGGDGDDLLHGGAGDDTMVGNIGHDNYYVDSAADVVIEFADEGTDTVYSSAYSYVLAANVENLSMDTAGASAVYGTGNDGANFIYGNSGSNTLNGGAGVDSINGLGGEDTFVFHAGEANGDTLYEFEGNGLGSGDVIYFVGYGTAAEGAIFLQLDATSWEITSADGTIHDIIYLAGAPTVDATDFSFY